MSSSKFLSTAFAVLLCLSVTVSAADKKSKDSKAEETNKPSYELPQPATENLDYTMYQRIRDEGLAHSHVMEFASALADGIGPRLTGSPNLKRANEWTRDQFAAMGCSNAHLEDWGEFGMGWRQLNTWVRMSAPDTAVFIAQALPWSPASKGPVGGRAIWVTAKDEKDLEKYKGKLAGKIVFFGEMREVKPVDKPLFERRDDANLKQTAEFPVRLGEPSSELEFIKRLEFREKVGQFLAAEHAAAVVIPSRDGRNNGGSGGTIFDDGGSGMGWFTYQREHAEQLPVVVTAIENYGRVYRLLKANVPVTIEMDVETEFTGDHEHGFDTIAEIPGTDPKLKDEVVMVGGHLDSWASATGATDNGAGTVVAMEVMRILNALHVQPRRTIRVGLWTGEEQGEFGSYGYVKQHFGYVPLSTEPDQIKLPDFLRKPSGAVQLKPEQQKISGYFNVDNGSGKIRGIYLQENSAVAPIFQQWIAPLQDLGVTTLTMRNTGGTDHEAFDSVGVPGFQFIQDMLDYGSRTHHSNMDTYERLQPDDLAQAAVVEAIFVYNTAMRDQMLPRKPLPRPELEEQRKAPLKNVMPGAEAAAEEMKKPEN
ncbi:MAG TPA: M20/M25/M40 family metallo-hydrolase [Candidatus Sulfotelmatobacter sp.]|nr:M20/M25/M40 family metallo-hydrolase [Candidatus Sulfotelmatobacter sp.]